MKSNYNNKEKISDLFETTVVRIYIYIYGHDYIVIRGSLFGPVV